MRKNRGKFLGDILSLPMPTLSSSLLYSNNDTYLVPGKYTYSPDIGLDQLCFEEYSKFRLCAQTYVFKITDCFIRVNLGCCFEASDCSITSISVLFL